MTHVRRPSLLEPGEPLLLARSAIDTAVRFQAFADESGIAPSSILTTPLCATPLPLYGGFTGHRWPGTSAACMWHPLMWLPKRVAGRYLLTDSEGSERLEDDDLWAIRVALELTNSGLYDPESGTWFDVLQLVGIDIGKSDDLRRVQAWLDGGSDADLDSLDLSEYLDVEPSSWALESALEIRDDVVNASWAVVADDLLELADEILDNSDEALDPGNTAVQSLAGLAQAQLANVPIVTPAGDPTTLDDMGHRDFFASVYETAHQMTPDQARQKVGQARDRLFAIREAYWPSVEALAALEEEPTPA